MDGFATGMAAANRFGHGDLKLECVPADTTRGQMLQAFYNWHGKNRAKWNVPAAAGVYEAFLETWPCVK